MGEIRLLTDDRIVELAGNRVITNVGDFNLKYKYVHPVKGGLFDPVFFGSIYPDKCNCGRIHTKSKIPLCKVCNSAPLPDDLQDSIIGRIELCNYYVNEIYHPMFIDELNKVCTVKFKKTSTKKVMKKLYMLAWTVSEDGKKVVPTLEYDDPKYVGLSGLIEVMKENDISTSGIRKYLLSNVIVPGIQYRKVSFTTYTGKKEMMIDPMNTEFMGLMTINNLCKQNPKKVILRAYLSNYADRMMASISEVLRSSKSNYGRKLQALRTPESGRLVLSNNADIKMDEVSLPLSAVYESFGTYFIDYLVSIGYTKAEAMKLYKYPGEDVLKTFDGWIKGQTVIIGRQPTLHRGSILAMKVVVDYENPFTIGLNPAILQSLNADYDGDQIWFRAIRPQLSDYVIKRMSPRYYTKYVKNGASIINFNHAQMAALIRYTRVDTSKTIISNIDISKYSDKDVIHMDNPVSYRGFLSSPRRLYLSSKLGIDIDILSEGKTFDAGLIGKLLNAFDEDSRIDKIFLIQKLIADFITIEGHTTVDFDIIYPKFLKSRQDLIEFYESDEFKGLDKSHRLLRLTALYEKMLEEYESIVKTNDRIRESNRVKLSSLSAMALPVMIVGSDGDVEITDGALLDGYSEEAMHQVAVNNRAVHYVKLTSVPESGYLFRQLTELAANYRYDSSEPTVYNIIEADAKDSIGRTKEDGELVVGNEGVVRILSLIGTNVLTISKSLLPADYTKFESGLGLGYDLSSAFEEAITQSQLALKHGGSAYTIDEANIRVTEECTISSVDGDLLHVKGISGKEYTYLIDSGLVVNNTLYPGELNSYCKLITPSFGLKSIIAAIGATGVNSTVSEINLKSNSLGDCFAFADGEIDFEVKVAGTSGKVTKYVVIDGIRHRIQGTCFYPSGYRVKKGERISDDNFNISSAIEKIGYVEAFYLFKKFIRAYNNLSDIILEFIYNLITPNKKFIKVKKSLSDRDNFFEKLSYQDTRRVIREEITKSKEENDDSSSDKSRDPSLYMHLYL